jgi:hypothetical protein
VLVFSVNLPAFGNNSGQDEVKRDFQKTVTLSGNQGVSLDHRLGQVRIHGGSGHEVNISATIRVQSHTNSDAHEFAQKIEIEVRESNDGVHIRTIYPDNKFPVIRIGGRTSYSVDYDIAMPADAPLWMHNDFGNAEISSVGAA